MSLEVSFWREGGRGGWWDEDQGVTIGLGSVRSLGTLARAVLRSRGMEAEMDGMGGGEKREVRNWRLENSLKKFVSVVFHFRYRILHSFLVLIMLSMSFSLLLSGGLGGAGQREDNWDNCNRITLKRDLIKEIINF